MKSNNEVWADALAERLAATIRFLRIAEDENLRNVVERESVQARRDLFGLERFLKLEEEEL